MTNQISSSSDTDPSTHQAAPQSAPTAGVLRRFAGLTYDALLLLAISIGYGALATWANVLLQGQPPEGQKVEWGHWGLLMFLGWMICLVIFFCYFWRKSGQTLGMRAWRMKLVSHDFTTPSIEQCLIRCFVAPFSLLLLGLGYFWRWFDPQKLTLHDRLSKTQVILLPKDQK